MSAWWRAIRRGAVAVVVALTVACGDGNETGTGETTTTTEPAETTTTAIAGTTTTVDPATPGSTPEHDTAGTIPGSDTEGRARPPDLTGEEICELLPTEDVSAALDVPVATAPGRTSTPQCSYRFAGADGVATEATVAALRTDGDLGGRVGPEAFTYVVDLNRSAATGEVTETPLAVGDRATILTGGNLDLAVVQLGGRVVTVILAAGAGDLDDLRALAAAAATALAP